MRTSGLSGRVQTKKPSATNSVLAPPSCSALRAPRYNSTKRASRSASSRRINTSRRCKASAAWAPCRSSRWRASCSCWLRGSLPAITSRLGSSLMVLPSASTSSNAAAATSSSSAFLPGRKFSNTLRSDRSSSRRCQRASRSLGSSSALGMSSLAGSRSCAGASSMAMAIVAARGAAVSIPGSAGAGAATACAWASGLMRTMRARLMSTTSSNCASSASPNWRTAWAMAWLKRTGWPCAAKVVSNTSISCNCKRLRRAVTSSTTALVNSCWLSHTPAKAWPLVNTSSGFRCACSRQAANSSVKSRQVAKPASVTWLGLRTFWPVRSKLAGGSA